MPLYNGNIQTAVAEWVANPTTAEAKYGHISNWDVSQVTNMNLLFSLNNGNGQFNEDISNWDTSNVTDMTYMFLNNTQFNQSIGNWNTSKVVKMMAMFYGSTFNQPVNSWDVSSVTDMKSMFMYNNVFNQPLDQWDVSSVTTIDSMFAANSGQFNQDISMWDVSNINSANGFLNFGQNQFNHSSDLFKNSDPYYFNIVSYFNIVRSGMSENGNQSAPSVTKNGVNVSLTVEGQWDTFVIASFDPSSSDFYTKEYKIVWENDPNTWQSFGYYLTCNNLTAAEMFANNFLDSTTGSVERACRDGGPHFNWYGTMTTFSAWEISGGVPENIYSLFTDTNEWNNFRTKNTMTLRFVDSTSWEVSWVIGGVKRSYTVPTYQGWTFSGKTSIELRYRMNDLYGGNSHTLLFYDS